MTQGVLFQKVEGFVILVASLILYYTVGGNWWLFVLLLFVPDISMAGYWLGNQAGQTIYNVVHTYALPLLLALIGFIVEQPLLLSLSLIWVAHIGLDRTIGYGLKEAQGFKFTHLGNL